MTYYPRSAYGSGNPNAGHNANGDTNAWGGYQWPNCPPSSLLGTTDYTSKVSGQRLRVTVRRELVELLTLIWQICDKHGYTVYSNKDGENWGPWGMDCRAVSGTNTPSGHSKGLSIDINAPYNPYSYTFTSDMPPAMVADIESVGWYWGGRYEGQKYDAMHYGYCWSPGNVAGHVQKAKNIVGGTPPTGDWFDMATEADLRKIVGEEINAKVPSIVNDVTAGVLRAPEFKLTDYEQKLKPFIYRVYRHTATQIDYAAGPGRFKFINSPDDYHFLYSCGWINIQHDQAQPVETNLLEYIRDEAARGADPANIDAIIYPGTPAAAAANAAMTA